MPIKSFDPQQKIKEDSDSSSSPSEIDEECGSEGNYQINSTVREYKNLKSPKSKFGHIQSLKRAGKQRRADHKI